jgi:DNA-binding GntR family transcriptional regulator
MGDMVAIPRSARDQRSSVDVVYDEILGRIVRGELEVGSPIKGSSVASELGTSRTPVAKAIERLCTEGLLSQEHNHRAVVAAGAERWFMNLHEVRILLEPAAAASAAGTLTQAVLQRLHSLATAFHQSDESAKREAAFQFDYELHVSIADASGNLLAKSIIRKCMSYKRFAYSNPDDPIERLERSHREHLEILLAIEHGDRDMASAAMSFHLHSTVTTLRDRHVV